MAEYLHKVKEHDTVLSICLIYGMTHQQFCELNPDFDPVMGHRFQVVPNERVVIGNSSNIFDRLRVEMRRQR